MAGLSITVPWQELGQWFQRRLEDRHFKGKTVRLHLKNGRILEGPFERYSVEYKTLFVSGEEHDSRGVPIDNVLFLEVVQAEQSPVPKNYAFAGLNHTLADFPHPFVTADGSSDLLFVCGEGSRDYVEYRQFLRQKGELELPPTRVGRRGDFEYFATLAFALGFFAARINPSVNLPTLPRARQGFQVDDEALNHNLIAVGSGAVNTFTKLVFEIYGEELPVRFKAPDSDELIIDQVNDESRVYSRRNDGEWNAGLIELVPNPFNPSKVVLIAAGLTVAGTQAALLALCDAVSRKTLRNRIRKLEGGTMTVPAQLVMAKNTRYTNGLETVYGYDLVS